MKAWYAVICLYGMGFCWATVALAQASDARVVVWLNPADYLINQDTPSFMVIMQTVPTFLIKWVNNSESVDSLQSPDSRSGMVFEKKQGGRVEIEIEGSELKLSGNYTLEEY